MKAFRGYCRPLIKGTYIIKARFSESQFICRWEAKPTMYVSGMDGEAIFFSRGGAGRGGARPKIYGAGRGGEPPPPHRSGLGGEGVKICGAGNILRVLIEIICCSKEISICIALSEVNLLNSTKDDILDMEELFHMLTNFQEQSLMPY